MMHAQIYVNLPIRDMAHSRTFFESLGYAFNPQFSNEQNTCLVLDDNLFVMLLVEPFFQNFTPQPMTDTTKTTKVLICVSCASAPPYWPRVSAGSDWRSAITSR